MLERGFADFKGFLSTLTALAAIAAGWLFVLWVAKSWQLVRETFVGQPSGSRVEALRVVAAAAISHKLGSKASAGSHTIYERTRMRVEHELLYPRPTVDEAESAEEHERRIDDWHAFMRREAGKLLIGNRAEDGLPPPSRGRRRKPTWTPRPLTAGDVNDSFAGITRYFVALRKLTASEKVQFVCSVRIETGFIAPLHLLAGLLSRFDEDWRRILGAFNQDIVQDKRSEWLARARGDGPEPPGWSASFRLIQKFIFDCWLQWGPSIPHSASQGDQEWTSIQYGFGDENNSIDVVGPRASLGERLQALWKGQAPKPMAMPARVQGRLAHCQISADLRPNVSEALKTSWHFDSADLSQGRIILFADEQHGIETRDPAYYYSAYLWIQFVVMTRAPDGSKGKFLPLHSDPLEPDASAKPWFDFLPFFEHGNIASPPATELSKNLLALKALDGIRQLVELSGGPTKTPLRFGYSCAIDDPGDGRRSWLAELGLIDEGNKTLHELLEELSFRSDYRHLFAGDDPIVLLDHYATWSEEARPHTTHRLINHVRDTLDHVQEVSATNAQARAYRRFHDGDSRLGRAVARLRRLGR
jgi:hypothetical protein